MRKLLILILLPVMSVTIAACTSDSVLSGDKGKTSESEAQSKTADESANLTPDDTQSEATEEGGESGTGTWLDDPNLETFNDEFVPATGDMVDGYTQMMDLVIELMKDPSLFQDPDYLVRVKTCLNDLSDTAGMVLAYDTDQVPDKFFDAFQSFQGAASAVEDTIEGFAQVLADNDLDELLDFSDDVQATGERLIEAGGKLKTGE